MNGIVIVLVASAITLLSLAVYGWLFTRGRSAALFATFITLCAFYTAIYAFQILAIDIREKILWARLFLVPSALIPLVWFFFAVRRSEGPYRIPKIYAFLGSVIPVITVVLAVTNVYPPLLRTDFQLLAGSIVPVLSYKNGPFFWIQFIYSYALGLASLIAMVASLRVPNARHRPQTIVLMVSIILPGMIELFFEMGVRPIPGFSFYPVALTASGILAAVALYSSRFFALLPVARSLVFTGLDDAVLVLDEESRICDSNPAANRLFGKSTGLAIEVRNLPQPWGDALGSLANRSLGHERLQLPLDGGISVFDVTVSPIRDEAGRPRGRCILVSDVSARAEMEKKLRDSEEKLRRFFEQATEAFALTDESGRIVEFNPAAEKLTGIPRTSALGRPAWDLQAGLLPTDRPRSDTARETARTMMEKALKTGSGEGIFRMFEGRIRGGDGQERSFEQMFFPIKTDDGYCLGSTASDTTLRMQGREALRKSEERLAQAQKMEAVGKLAGGIAHDFNNHLTVIGGYVETVLENLKDEYAREGIEEIRGAAERATALTSHLLAFSRKQVLAPRTIDPNLVISRSVKMLGRLLGENIVITTRLADGEHFIMADPLQIEQIIMNLAINARDAMPSGGTLAIETQWIAERDPVLSIPAELGSGPFVMIEVSDTGIGMDEATLSRLFEPFFTTKEAGRGVGLGTSIVYGFVHQNGGHISCVSTPGKGTTFTLFFPEVHSAAEPVAEPLPGPRARGRSLETILLVEDDDAVRKFIRGILRKEGYTVVEARNGPEALDSPSCRNCQFQLLVTDVVMPQMNGTDLAIEVAKRCPSMKVLFLSGYMEDEMLRQGVATGAATFLQKPFSTAVFLEKVHEILHANA